MRLAIDDFGTGYSSLRQLRALLPVDTLKIDKSFVDGIADDARRRRRSSTASCAWPQSLGLQAVAEGVETAEQVDELRAWAARRGQGYHFARPASPPRSPACSTARPAARWPA